MTEDLQKRTIRYAVVGLGHIAQSAVLPAFAHAEGCALRAVVSDLDSDKARRVAEHYQVPHVVDYNGFGDFLEQREVDAVYLATPNHLHCQQAVVAAAAGVNVLCEKPLAVTEEECRQMIDAAQRGGVKLMAAYRLHFEEGNLQAIDTVRSGVLGDVRLFQSAFSFVVEPGDLRVTAPAGGGALYDLGVYCINAARYLFGDEPSEVVAFGFNGGDPRFEGVDEAISAVLRFPGERAAAFTVSLNIDGANYYEVYGDRGRLRVEPAYTYVGDIRHKLMIDGEISERCFAGRDQFAALLAEFARCIREDREPEPDGWEGLADVRIINALHRSALERRPVETPPVPQPKRPKPGQSRGYPPIDEAPLFDLAGDA